MDAGTSRSGSDALQRRRRPRASPTTSGRPQPWPWPGHKQLDETSPVGPDDLALTTREPVDEAIRVANNSDYGLAGMVWVNCYEEGDLTVPFGGYKLSGNGRDKSVHALEKYTELTTTFIHL